MIDVSVIIPAHNAAATLLRAIKSVHRQLTGGLGVEIIVIDDGSTDDTLKHERSSSCRQVTFLQQPNEGAASARNRGIRNARGKYIAFLDADDEWTDQLKLRRQWEWLESHPECSIVCTDWRVLDGPPSMDMLARHKPRRITYTELLRECCMLTSTVMMRPACPGRRGATWEFDTRLRRGQDYDLWLRLAQDTQIWSLPDVTTTYHQHSGMSARKPLPRCYEAKVLSDAIYEYGRGQLTFHEMHVRLSNAYSNHAWAHIKHGSRLVAMRSALAALWHWPSLGNLKMLAKAVLP